MGVERFEIAVTGEKGATGGRTVPPHGKLAFRSVNTPGTPGYRPGMQRHHILPRQVARKSCFSRLVQGVGEERIAIDDFRSNGVLLPSLEQASQILGLPLHRGPHGRYNEVVMERFGQIEADWQRERMRNADGATMELLLQPARRLFRLNRRDPRPGQRLIFGDLDAMAEVIWARSGPPDG